MSEEERSSFSRAVLGMTTAQVKALLQLIPPGYQASGRAILLEETWTFTGGTHLYAKIQGRHYHISQDGIVKELTAQEKEDSMHKKGRIR